MLGLGRKRQGRSHGSEQQADEIVRLRGQVRRLETALTDVLQASDGVVSDLQLHQLALAKLSHSSGFARAWDQYEPSNADADDFFGLTHVDLGARKWLLAN